MTNSSPRHLSDAEANANGGQTPAIQPPTGAPIPRYLRPDEQLCFVHIAKNGGTTLVKILESFFPPEQIFDGYDEATVAKLTPEQRHQYKFYRGHFHYLILKLLPGAVPITVLRNPLERARSVFQHIQRSAPHRLYGAVKDLSFRDYVFSDPEISWDIQNHQTRVISGMLDLKLTPDLELAKRRLREEFVFVGILERYEESLELLTYTLGWPPIKKYHRMNVTPNKIPPKEIDDDARQQLMKLNELDLELYEYGQQLFAERYEYMQAQRDTYTYQNVKDQLQQLFDWVTSQLVHRIQKYR